MDFLHGNDNHRKESLRRQGTSTRALQGMARIANNMGATRGDTSKLHMVLTLHAELLEREDRD